ncbi:MAG TPA: hypothetical protein VF774_19860 [Pseudoduganella sp.]
MKLDYTQNNQTTAHDCIPGNISQNRGHTPFLGNVSKNRGLTPVFGKFLPCYNAGCKPEKAKKKPAKLAG